MSRVFVSQEIVDDALAEFDGTGIAVDLRRDHGRCPPRSCVPSPRATKG